MTKSPDTEALGLRGLFAEARQAGDMAAARRYAERGLRPVVPTFRYEQEY